MVASVHQKTSFTLTHKFPWETVFQCRINYFLHWFRATSPWYLSSEHLACHTQGWDIWIK